MSKKSKPQPQSRTISTRRLTAPRWLIPRVAAAVGLLLVLNMLMRPILWIQMTAAERRWNDQQIDSYTIAIDDDEGNFGRRRYRITVEDGEVRGETPCQPGDEALCEMDPQLAERFTVDSLFDRAGAYFQYPITRRLSAVLSVRFNSVFGYPSYIHTDNLNLVDAATTITVVDFQPRP